jgi:hypothetical protein
LNDNRIARLSFSEESVVRSSAIVKCFQSVFAQGALILAVSSLFSASLASVAHAEIGVLGFHAWKTGRLEEARANLERVQTDAMTEKASLVDRAPAMPSSGVQAKDVKTARGPKGPRVDQRLEQAKLNVEITQELSVQDYFVLYLSQFKNREAFLEAAKKLNAEETAELMMAYKKELGSENTQEDLPGGIGSTLAAPAAAKAQRH